MMKIFCCTALLLIHLKSYAQDSLYTGTFDSPAIAPVIYVVEVKEVIQVDGKLDEASWKDNPLWMIFSELNSGREGSIYIPPKYSCFFIEKY